MPSNAPVNSFVLGVEAFDRSLLPPHARSPGTDAFSQEVTRHFQREYAKFGGFVRVVVSAREIEVTWTADESRPDPRGTILRCLDQGDLQEAARLLTVFLRHHPDDFEALYNLGLLVSDAGEPRRAEELLRRALQVKPNDVNALVALGVALSRRDQLDDAVAVLRQAANAAPDNSWAHLNLGACLARLGNYDDAEPSLRRSLELNPADPRALFNLAKLLIRTDRESEADSLLVQIIEQGEPTPLVEAAEQERSRLAQKNFRNKPGGSLRPDAVMYLVDAMEKFSVMSPEQVRDVGVEIAMLGRQGLDVNDSTQRYQLTRIPGRFSALNLVCLMYAAFKQVSPDADIGFDLSQEYAAAIGLRST